MRKILIIILILSTITTNAQRVLTLDSCRTLALQNAEDIKKSANKLVESDYTLKNAKSSLLPSLDASGNLIFMFPNIDVMGSDLVLK